MLTTPVTCDHVITQNVNKDLLILTCTCYHKTLSYHLQIANVCKIYMITGHTMQNLYDHWPYINLVISTFL